MTEEREKNAIIPGTLYLVATPIGNLADISERALKVLSGVDFIAAEDTRNTGLMLSRLGISKPMVSYFEHNKTARGLMLAERLRNMESCALVTDAGTPAISDPGEDIARLCHEKGIPVTSVPGCCAAIDALILSGLATRRFVFEGFLPPKGRERKEVLDDIASEKRTVILYEAPHRLLKTLEELAEVSEPGRRISICRELTKLNEEVIMTTCKEAPAIYSEKSPRGEYVLVLEGRSGKDTEGAETADPVSLVAEFERDGMSRMEAIKAAAKAAGMKKNDLYMMVNKT